MNKIGTKKILIETPKDVIKPTTTHFVHDDLKVAIIYSSRSETSNTKKIVDAIESSLKCDAIEVGNAFNINIDEYDIVGFASGIYINKFAKSLISYVQSLKEIQQKAFVIYTSGAKQCDKALTNFVNLLMTKKRKVIGHWHCLGRDVFFTPFKKTGGFNKGRPNEDDCNNAIAWLRDLIKGNHVK